MRFLNLKITLDIKKVHSFWDVFRLTNVPEIKATVKKVVYKPLKTKPDWELDISPEKRMRTMCTDILRYAFRDVGLEMIAYPEKALAIFLSIISFTHTFRNDMILKGANKESVISYDLAVEKHIESTLTIVNNKNPNIYKVVMDALEEEM